MYRQRLFLALRHYHPSNFREPFRTVNQYGQRPPESERFAFRRAVRRFVTRGLLFSIVIAIQAGSAKAQHCGRIDMTTVWSDSRPSWERDDARVDPSGRIRTTECEGPLCRSRTPQPFADPGSSVGAIVPLPWNSTSVVFAVSQDRLAGSISPESSIPFPSPCFDPLFEPPRNA